MFAERDYCLPKISGIVGGMQMHPDWARLAAAVRSARGLRTQKAIADAGGPSDTTIGKIEANEWRPKRGVGDTLDKLDKGLGWSPGSAERILAGGDPTPSESEPHAAEQSAGPVHSAAIDYAPLIAGLAVDTEDLLNAARNLDTMINTDIDVDDTDQVETLVSEVETLISDVDALVTDIDEFADLVDDYARKIVGLERLRRLKRDTRSFRRRQTLQQLGPGFFDDAGREVSGSSPDRDRRGADAAVNQGETASNTTGSGDPVPSDATAAAMTDEQLRAAAAKDPLWADYIKTKRPELADWDF